MLPRSSSTSSCRRTSNENLCPTNKLLHHSESSQNLEIKSSSHHPLTIDNNHLNLPAVPHPKNDSSQNLNEKQLRRTIVQDDMENIQERLNEMLIAVPNENEKPLLNQQKSTNEYFTPKISIEDTQLEDDEDDHDRNSH